MQVLDLITRAATRVGILQQGETLNGSESTDAFNALNDMLDAWNTDRLNIYTVGQAQYALTATVQAYPIGPTASAPFNVNRPVLIQSASIILPGTTIRQPMRIMTSAEFPRIKERGLTGVLPDKLYCDYAAPNATLYVHPIPSGTPTLELYAWSALAAFVTLQDTVTFPPGYVEAIVFNLALKLAPEYGQQVDSLIAQTAMGSKQAMRALNAQMLQGAVGTEAETSLPIIGEPQPQVPMVQPGQPGPAQPAQ